MLTEDEINALSLADLRAILTIDEALLDERNRILAALPCPAHGPCVPYVLDWIATQRALVAGNPAAPPPPAPPVTDTERIRLMGAFGVPVVLGRMERVTRFTPTKPAEDGR